MFDWDDLRVFLSVARAGRMAGAARALAVDATTITRRIARLQAALGAELFETVAGARRLTERGQTLFAHAETIEAAALAAAGDVGGEAASLSGHVRLSVAEGFASWVLAPGLAGFARRHPAIRLDLVTASGFLNPSKREADMAVMLARPRGDTLAAAKLGDYRLRLYAARDYADVPATVAALGVHPLTGYVPEYLYSPELDYLREIGPALEPTFRSPSITVQHRMIAGGAGIGVLPCFIGERDPGLVPVLADRVAIVRSFWLVTHGDMRRLARIDAVGRWVRECAEARL